MNPKTVSAGLATVHLSKQADSQPLEEGKFQTEENFKNSIFVSFSPAKKEFTRVLKKNEESKKIKETGVIIIFDGKFMDFEGHF